MDGRRRLGAVLLVAGLALIGVGAYGLATADSPSTSAATATPSLPPPTQVTEPSDTPTPFVPTSGPKSLPPPTPTPTPVPETPVPAPDRAKTAAEFYAKLVAAIRAADADTLVAMLHPTTLDRYGLAACRATLGALEDPTFDIVVGNVDPFMEWDYVTDERTTTIPSAWTVHATFTSQGETSERELHVAMVGNELRWFTDCGTPLS